MEKIRVYLLKKNAAYFSLLDEYNERYRRSIELHPYSNEDVMEAMRAQFEQELLESEIPNSETISEECEMVYVNYDAFNCVLLHKDGTYTQHSLSEVKLIR